MSFERKEKEDLISYANRITENRKELDLDYAEWGRLISNKEYSSDNCRKAFYLLKLFLERIKQEKVQNLDNSILEEHENQKIEIIKEKVKLRDQRRELNKLITETARWENLKEEIITKVEEINKDYPLVIKHSEYIESENKREALLLLSDWHYGLEIDNIINKYNPDIARERIDELLNRVIKYCKNNKVNKINVMLQGDLLSGIIHTNLRLQNVEDIISQTVNMSEILSVFISELNKYIPEVDIHYTIGNHGRVSSNKKEAINSENFEFLLPIYLGMRLKENKNIKIIKSEFDRIVYLNILGHEILGVHGDTDNLKTVIHDLTKLTHVIPYMVCFAHYHKDFRDEDGSLLVVNGSLSGVDEYALDKRYVSRPHQKLIIFEENIGEICTYKVNF